MFYICSKKEQSMGVIYGIMDTKDGIVEYYSPRDIMHFVSVDGLDIKGVTKVGDKYRFKVLEPTAFKEVDSGLSEKVGRTEVSSELLSNHLEIYYPENWDSIENLDYNYLDIIFRPLRLQLSDIVFTLFKVDVSKQPLQYIDGYECIGYQGIKIPNTDYNLSIYSNPEQSGNGEVLCYGIGIDIDGVGKPLSDCHFDNGFTDDLTTKFNKWYNELITINKNNSSNIIKYNSNWGYLYDLISCNSIKELDTICQLIESYVVDQLNKIFGNVNFKHANFGDNIEKSKWDYTIYCTLNDGNELEVNCIVENVSVGLLSLNDSIGISVLNLNIVNSNIIHHEFIYKNSNRFEDAKNWYSSLLCTLSNM